MYLFLMSVTLDHDFDIFAFLSLGGLTYINVKVEHFKTFLPKSWWWFTLLINKVLYLNSSCYCYKLIFTKWKNSWFLPSWKSGNIQCWVRNKNVLIFYYFLNNLLITTSITWLWLHCSLPRPKIQMGLSKKL